MYVDDTYMWVYVNVPLLISISNSESNLRLHINSIHNLIKFDLLSPSFQLQRNKQRKKANLL